ncbi:phenylacetyl-CoA ligase [Lentinula aciculospora]|uniref:Phenylacetyl-CoA ligase n=1 Tax=Lentinula aciculospora TaxID=153920 RepID=A0A9W8ZTX9_9AGAR|nr:phenylacetyl-CoA ligase [Lentinula aciculospora]
MSIIQSFGAPLPTHMPDYLTIPQFILDKSPIEFLNRTSEDTARFYAAGTTCMMIEEETGQHITLPQMKERANALARGLKSRYGLRENDIASIFSPNHIDYAICVWATHRLGGIISPMSSTLTTSELEYQLKLIHCNMMFVHSSCLTVALEAITKIGGVGLTVVVIDSPINSKLMTVDNLVDIGLKMPPYKDLSLVPGEARKKIAFLCFSSGTTGLPKAVMISHFNVICNIIQAATFNHLYDSSIKWEEQRFRAGDVSSLVLPLYHIYGLVMNLHYVLFAGMNLVISGKFDFTKMLKSIKDYRISHLWIVPPQAVLFCKHAAVKSADLSSIRCCLVGAAPVTADLSRQLLAVLPGIHFGQGYGMTESSPTITMFPLSQKVGTLGSAGHFVSGTMAKIVTADGKLAAYGEAGELFVKGGQVSLGYYNNLQETQDTFIDGWLKTGDVAIVHSNGDVFVIDRIKELIKVKGLQVAPAELEGHLLVHPDIADAAVIGVPDEYTGQLPRAYVVLQPEQASAIKHDPRCAEEIRTRIFEHVSTALAKHKWLKGGIVFVDAIPKSSSGKILHRLLNDELVITVGKIETKL